MNKKIWCFLGVHDMEVIKQGPYERENSRGKIMATGCYYVLKCKTCGTVKRKVLCS